MSDRAKALCLGVVVSGLIVAFHSPSWVAFAAWRAKPEEFWDLKAVRRGAAVAQQVVDPHIEIHDPLQAGVRWRLFFPVLGHVLRLPPVLVLALSPLGCVVVLSSMIAAARRRGVAWVEATLLAIVAGSASWFFVSTGWLGYFDSWLALALLIVAFARWRSLVVAACLFAPWIDERFVIGFPLAFLVRWLDHRERGGPPGKTRRWLVREGLAPAAGLGAVVALRLSLTRAGGSDHFGTYWQSVAFFHLPLARLAFGTWEGLRFGWVLVISALWLLTRRENRFDAMLLAVGVLSTTVAGTASDLSRSATLAIPVVPFGWGLARSTETWRRWPLAWVLAALALALPAHHVVSDFTMSVNSFWRELTMLGASGFNFWSPS